MADITSFPSASAATTPLVDLQITLDSGFSEREMFEALTQINQALNKIAGEALRSGLMTTANPVVGNLLNSATHLEQAVLTAKQIQQAGSGLMLPGGPRRMN